MFRNQAPSPQLSLPVCVTDAEKQDQEKVSNKSVCMLKNDILGMLTFVTDTQLRTESVAKFKKASVKKDYITLHEEIVAYFEKDISESLCEEITVPLLPSEEGNSL